MNKKILIFSKKEFDEICINSGWNDKNVESLYDIAFISIGDSETSHLFASSHFNVLNIDFDDVSDEDDSDLIKFNESMARKSVKFIEDNIGKTFMIHCLAGVSRSQAFFRFITDFYKDCYGEDCGRRDNPCINPNIHVVRMLKNEYYRKHGTRKLYLY